MSDVRNDSLLEIALKLMKDKRTPKPISKISKDVFETKGLSKEEYQNVMGQFEMDFMLSGYFICCGEDKKTGEKLWDLKNRQPFSLLDKDGNSLDDPYNNDEDVIANELKDDNEYEDRERFDDNDDDDEDSSNDDFEQELLELHGSKDDSATEIIMSQSDDEVDEIEEELNMSK